MLEINTLARGEGSAALVVSGAPPLFCSAPREERAASASYWQDCGALLRPIAQAVILNHLAL